MGFGFGLGCLVWVGLLGLGWVWVAWKDLEEKQHISRCWVGLGLGLGGDLVLWSVLLLFFLLLLILFLKEGRGLAPGTS